MGPYNPPGGEEERQSRCPAAVTLLPVLDDLYREFEGEDDVPLQYLDTEAELLRLKEQAQEAKWLEDFRLAQLIDEWEESPDEPNIAASVDTEENESNGVGLADEANCSFNEPSPLTDIDEVYHSMAEFVQPASDISVNAESEASSNYIPCESATGVTKKFYLTMGKFPCSR